LAGAELLEKSGRFGKWAARVADRVTDKEPRAG
jgi:hypothetical protein